MDDIQALLKRSNVPVNLEYLRQIKWTQAFSQLILQFGLIYGFYLILTNRALPWTYLWTFVVWAIAGIGTGIGSHRYFSHRSFKATRGFKFFLIFCQTVSGEYSIHYWVRTHRVHHKFTDTDRDPTNVNRGFFFSYVGFLFLPRHPDCQKEWDRVNLSDIEADKDIMFQYRHYEILWAIFCIALPTFIPCYLWNETLWIAFFMNLFRYATNFAQVGMSNTISHMYGSKSYDAAMSAADNFYMNTWSFGEGYHNFHHVFPSDYKGSEFEGFRKFNILTMFIHFFEFCGWVHDLKTTSPEMIERRMRRTGDGTQ